MAHRDEGRPGGGHQSGTSHSRFTDWADGAIAGLGYPYRIPDGAWPVETDFRALVACKGVLVSLSALNATTALSGRRR